MAIKPGHRDNLFPCNELEGIVWVVLIGSVGKNSQKNGFRRIDLLFHEIRLFHETGHLFRGITNAVMLPFHKTLFCEISLLIS